MGDQRKSPNFECPNPGCEFGCGTLDDLKTHRRKCLIGFDKNYKPSEISLPRRLGEQIVRKACHRTNRLTGLRCGNPVTDPGGYKCAIGSMSCRCPPTCDRIVPNEDYVCGRRVNHEGTKCSLRDTNCLAYVKNFTNTCIRKRPDTGTHCGQLVKAGHNQCSLQDINCNAYVETLQTPASEKDPTRGLLVDNWSKQDTTGVMRMTLLVKPMSETLQTPATAQLTSRGTNAFF